MQLTIDSTEPLSKVAAVVGALYGVELVVSSGDTATAAPDGRRRKAAIAASTNAKRSAGRSRKGGGTKVDASIVRQWAVENGMTVSTRGQLPKAVLVAYNEQTS